MLNRTIVLVHGAWYNASCWHKVVPFLTDAGFTVLAPDMPGYGRNGPPDPDTDLEDYVDALANAINSVPEPVMLVGHSLGGIIVSQTAERLAGKISSLTYICAFMLKDGQSRISMASEDPGSIALKYRIAAGEGLISFTRDGFPGTRLTSAAKTAARASASYSRELWTYPALLHEMPSRPRSYPGVSGQDDRRVTGARHI